MYIYMIYIIYFVNINHTDPKMVREWRESRDLGTKKTNGWNLEQAGCPH